LKIQGPVFALNYLLNYCCMGQLTELHIYGVSYIACFAKALPEIILLKKRHKSPGYSLYSLKRKN